MNEMTQLSLVIYSIKECGTKAQKDSLIKAEKKIEAGKITFQQFVDLVTEIFLQ